MQLTALALLFATGCSVFRTRPLPTSWSPPTPLPAECTTSVTPPVVDAVVGVALLASAVVLVVPSTSPAPPESRVGSSVLGGVAALVFGGSSLYGFRNVASCNAARLGTDAASRKFTEAMRLSRARPTFELQVAAVNDYAEAIYSLRADFPDTNERATLFDRERFAAREGKRSMPVFARDGDLMVLHGSVIVLGREHVFAPVRLPVQKTGRLLVTFDYDTALAQMRVSAQWVAAEN